MALTLACQRYGDNASTSPIIVLHGLFGSARNWHSISQRLGEARRVYAVDLRNHGQSPWRDEMDYHAMADDLDALMAQEQLAAAVVVGHSMGGKAAMTFALQQPERVERLVVLDIAPVTYHHDHDAYIAAMQALDLDQIVRRSDADAQLAKAIPEQGIRQFLLQNLVQQRESKRYSWRINLTALAAHMAELVEFPALAPGQRYDKPTLFVAGERSDYILPQHHEAIRERFPSATIETLPGAGHWLHAERPDWVLDRLQSFLA